MSEYFAYASETYIEPYLLTYVCFVCNRGVVEPLDDNAVDKQPEETEQKKEVMIHRCSATEKHETFK